MIDAQQWNEAAAAQMADAYGVRLNDSHWAIIWELRRYFEAGNKSPSMRQLVRLVKSQVDPELGSSIALMKLFGPSPAKMSARLAGLPKPKNCL